ncbi:MAG: cyclase family protein [Gemmatimonadota bacterium]
MIYDISPPLSPDIAVFPGDTALSREVLLDIGAGDNITLSTLRSTVHLGSHADAPSHYAAGGQSIDRRPLDLFLGPCQVVRPDVAAGELVSIAAVEAALDESAGDASGITQARVLIATGTAPDPSVFPSAFAGLEPELVDWLAAQGVVLVGVDTPSVDPGDSKDLAAHAAVARHDMNILEGLVLDQVPAGEYELIALPLRLVGFDGSPVRAVLRTL